MKPAAVAALFAFVPLAAQAQEAGAPQRPPDGVYHYTLAQDGKTIGTSQLTFNTAAGRLTVSESADLGQLEASTETLLDAGTLEEQQMRGTSPQQGAFYATVEDGGVAMKSGDIALTVKMLPGTARVLVSDGLVTSFALLPALTRVAANASLTDVAVNGAKAVALDVKPVTNTAPSGVPAGDSGLQVDAGSVSYQVWCDPNTLVVHLVRGGPGGFEIRLAR